MKKINVIVRALVACIALGNLPIDAMRNQGRTQRPIPAPSGKTPTTKTGAEAAANRLLAQDISKMNRADFNEWNDQLMAYINQVGIGKPAYNRLVSQARQKTHDKQKKLAAQEATEDIIQIAQGSEQLPSRSEALTPQEPISRSSSQQDLPFDDDFSSAFNTLFEEEVISQIPPLEQTSVEGDVKPSLLSEQELFELLDNVIAAGEGVVIQKSPLNANKAAMKVAESLKTKSLLQQNQFILALTNFINEQSELSSRSVRRAIESQIAWKQQLNSLPDIFLPYSMETIMQDSKVLWQGITQLTYTKILDEKYVARIKALSESAHLSLLMYSLHAITAPAGLLAISLAQETPKITSLSGAENVVNALDNSMRNNGQEPSLYFSTLFLLKKLDPEANLIIKSYLSNIKQLSTTADKFSDVKIKNFALSQLAAAKQMIVTMMKNAFDYSSKGTTALKYLTQPTSDSGEASIALSQADFDLGKITFANLVKMFKELTRELTKLFPDLASQVPTYDQVNQLVLTIEQAEESARQITNIPKKK